MSQQVMQQFYESFQQHNASEMVSLYHPEVTFSDPVFRNLNQKEVQGMWKMLIERSRGNLTIDYHSLIGDERLAQCIWEAKYPFSKTGRPVHNVIHATMEFKDGLIIKHTDDFNFWRWSMMALGTSGSLLGWTPLIKSKVQKMAIASLNKYLEQH